MIDLHSAVQPPVNAAGYHARAKTLLAEIGKLDTDYRTGLAHCKLTTFVTSHQAFAYMSKRYGLTMVGIAGVPPGHHRYYAWRPGGEILSGELDVEDGHELVVTWP